jgi:hypothetical protein
MDPLLDVCVRGPILVPYYRDYKGKEKVVKVAKVKPYKIKKVLDDCERGPSHGPTP